MINVFSVGAGKEQLKSIIEAQKMGLKVIALDGNLDSEGLKVADIGEVVDIKNKQEVIHTARRYNIKAVIPSPIGRYLTTVGAVNDALGLIGISEQAAINCTDKVKFNTLIAEANIKCANQVIASSYDEVICAVKKIGFPCILKPRYGSGSRGVIVIERMEGIEKKVMQHIDNCLKEDSIIEELLDGTEVGVDGAVVDSEFILTLVREKILTPFPYRQEIGYIAPARIENNMIKKIRQEINRLCQVLKLNNCLIQVDIIINENNKIIPIEIAGRPSGLMLSSFMTPYVTGINFLKNGIKLNLGEDSNFEAEFLRPVFLRFLDITNGKVLNVPNEEIVNSRKNILKYKCNIKCGDVLREVTCGRDVYYRGVIITTGATMNEAINEVNDVLDMFEIAKN